MSRLGTCCILHCRLYLERREVDSNLCLNHHVELLYQAVATATVQPVEVLPGGPGLVINGVLGALIMIKITAALLITPCVPIHGAPSTSSQNEETACKVRSFGRDLTI